MKDRILLFAVIVVVMTGGAFLLRGWSAAVATLLGCVLAGGIIVAVARFRAKKS